MLYARFFYRSGAFQAAARDISKVFNRIWHVSLLHKFTSHGISGQILDLLLYFFRRRQIQVVLDGKSSKEYSSNIGFPQGSILGPTLFLLYINDTPDDVICNIAIYVDAITLYSNCDPVSDL